MLKNKLFFLALYLFISTFLWTSEWESVGPYGGMGCKIYSVVQDFQNPQILYAGSNGGIYKSTDSGLSWFSINNGLCYQTITSLAIDHVNCSCIYAGSNSGHIFKSQNGGDEWLALNQVLQNIRVREIVIDPSNSAIIYVALGFGSFGGVFKSIDGGSSWIEISESFENHNIYSLAIDHNNPNCIYAGAVFHYNPITHGALYKSLDSGLTWETIQIPTSPNVYASISEIAIDPNNSNIIFVGTKWDGVFKSNDAGLNWIQANCGIWSFEQSNHNVIVVNPSDSSILYLGTHPPNSFEPCVFKSIDSGLNWFESAQGLEDNDVFSMMLAIENSDLIYAGTNSGFFKSHDSGNLWTASNEGLSTSFVFSIAISPYNPEIWIVGTSRGVFSTSDIGQNWNQGLATNALISSVAFHPIFPTVYATAGMGSYSDGIYKSYNNGISWGLVTYMMFPNHIAIDNVNPDKMYVSTNEHIYKTNNVGANWFVSDTGITEFPVYEIAIDPQNTNILFAISSTHVWKSNDGASLWNDIFWPFGLEDYNPNTIAINPQNSLEIFVGTYAGLVRSLDGGSNWEIIDIDDSNIQDIVIDPVNPIILYAGLDSNGVIKSEDSGLTWEEMNENLSNQIIKTLAIEPINSDFILAGSLGEGVFKNDLEQTSINSSTIISEKIISFYAFPNPFNPTTTIFFNLTAEDAENTELIIYNIKGQEIKQFSIFPKQSQAPYGAGNIQSSIQWEGKDENNKAVSSGVYFYELKSDKESIVRKMLLMK